MSACGFVLFETAIGCCGIAWSERGIIGVQLPEGSAQATRSRLLRRFPSASESAPPAQVQRTIEDIVALLGGGRGDLSGGEVSGGDLGGGDLGGGDLGGGDLGGAVLDSEAVPDFNRRVYNVARSIPAGSTLSYGEVAERLGDRNLARDVAQALGQNPFPIIVPCHRVMGAGGKTGGFSAPGGVRTKLRLLSIERAQPGGGPTLFADLPLAVRPRKRP